MNCILKEDLQRIVKQNINWNALKNKSVMVTGASGMVGSYFVRTLLELNESMNMGIKVIGVVRNVKKVAEDIKDNAYVELLSHDVTKP